MIDEDQNKQIIIHTDEDDKLDADSNQDYVFSRQKYYDLIKTQDEAIELMMDLARESEHPRAFEVLANMIKQNAEITDRVLDLQKRKKEIIKAGTAGGTPIPVPHLTQNNMFVGSTTDLQNLLINKQNEMIAEAEKAKIIPMESDSDAED